jgi:hypothetical protein
MKRRRRLHHGWLRGSHHVVDSAEYRTYLVDKNTKRERDIHAQTKDYDRVKWASGDLLAVDMESYGVLRVVEDIARKPPFAGGSHNLLGGIAIRGISDMCVEKKATDLHSKDGVRRLAVENLAEICLSFIESLDYASIVVRR